MIQKTNLGTNPALVTKTAIFFHLWVDSLKPPWAGRTHLEPRQRWREGFIFCVLMSYLGLGRLRLINLFKQFGPFWRELQVIRVGSLSDTKVCYLHPSPAIIIVWLSVSLTRLNSWDQALFSTLLCWSNKTLPKVHCVQGTAEGLWWCRISAFKKATVLKKQNWCPLRKRNLHSK